MKKDNFASTGGEQFELESQKEEKIVLDIQEEQEVTGVLLDGKVQEDESTGSVVKDAFNKTNKWFIKHSAVKVGDKATFFHLLAVMVNSGIPMIKSLKSLALQIEKSPRLKMIIEEVGAEIEEGSSLSVAMGHYPDVFFEQELGMIKSGEASGQLAKVLQALAHDTEKAYTIRRKVKSAMMYPIIVFLLLLAVISAMMIFVIPELTELFATMKQDLPMITKVVIAISDFMIESKFVLMVAILVMIASFMAFKRTQFGRYTLDKMKISYSCVWSPIQKSLSIEVCS
ncbi:type II secretion system F family protein [Candidatus Gracilibacteria bacterium]|nr:type II secretion system F family protein [Candidatus Gracilibacteria bacterium]